MISLYRDLPIYQMPFQILSNVLDLDNLLTKWRHTHALMVHRMLGSKMGTGGSSGFHYLRTAAVHHKVFTDFFNLSTYMIPRSNLPALPKSVKFFMRFPVSPKLKPRVRSGIMATSHRAANLSKELPPFSTLLATKSVSDLMLHSTAKLQYGAKQEHKGQHDEEPDAMADVLRTE